MADKPEAIVTPAGIAKYPRLNTPDTKFKPEGEYKVTLILSEKDKGVEAFLQKIRQAEADALKEFPAKKGKKQKVADSVIKAHLDENGDQVDGKVEVTAKTKASGVSKKGEKWERKVPMFDAKCHPVKDAKVGSGSKLKINVTPAAYDSPAVGVGVALYLNSVQIIDLVEFKGGQDAASQGFEEEEGEFTAPESGFEDESSEGDDESSDEGSDEGEDEKQEEAPKTPARRKGDF
jgi:hypothetical protein